ncbi:MAG: hypothetical protein Q8N44_07105 [Rubrivivax sp.]|nr:hypothetical protein [Rubrivivax sp.]
MQVPSAQQPSQTPVKSRAELARALNIDRAMVTRLARRGMPTDTVEAAQAWRCVNLNPAFRKDTNMARDPMARAGDGAAGSPGAPPGDAGAGDEPDGFMQHRARRERAHADLAELRVSRAAGKAVDKESAESAVFEAFRTLRDAVFAANRSAAPLVLGLTEAREVQHVLDDAYREAFAGWEVRMQSRMNELAAQ